MKSVFGSDKPFVIPAEVFQLLDPIEKIVIQRQAARGEVRIDAGVKS